MQKFDLSKILSCQSLHDLSFEEWDYINSLNFDILFEEKTFNHSFDSYNLLSDIVSGCYYFNIAQFEFVTYPSNIGSRPIITDKGWSFIKWSILNRFKNICEVIDELLLDEKNLEKKILIFNIFSLIPANNYGIMISQSKDPSKLLKLIDISSKV